MAKSLRSKRKRKVRAEKRIVNAKKELVKLKTIAARLHTTANSLGVTKETLEQANLPHVQVVKDTDAMQVDGDETDAATGKKAKLVINNQWMNQRKIKSIKNKIKIHNKKKSRRGGSGLSSRKVKKSLKK